FESAASTSPACVAGFTACITFLTFPSAPITKVERLTPQYFLPRYDSSFHTPYSSATEGSVSASSVKGSSCFLLNFTWERSSSGETPSTTAPALSNSPYASRMPHACFVQPGVSSRG